MDNSTPKTIFCSPHRDMATTHHDGATAKSNVFAVNLRKVSEIAGISYDQLITGIHTDDAMRMQGIVMEVDEDEADFASGAVDGKLDALVLTSTATTAFGVPLGLQQLNGKTVLEHALAQLLLAGIDRVVVAVAASSEIRAFLEKSVLSSRMNIVFLEVLPKVLESIPETVLAARHLFAGSFLIHAADRIFDKALLVRFEAFHRQHRCVCLLVESNLTIAGRMDPTTVRVQYTHGEPAKLHVGRDMADYNGVDAGLYVVSNKVFIVLDNLLHGVGSLSLAESLAFGFHRLKAMTVDDQPWFGVDTVQQMLHAVESNQLGAFTPYAFSRRNSPVEDGVKPKSRRQSVVLSVASSLENEPTIDALPRRRASRSEKIEPFEGFVVGVKTSSTTANDDDEETDRLLHSPRRLSIKVHECALPSDVTLSKSRANEYMLAIPLPPHRSNADDDDAAHRRACASPRHSAYLIQQPRASAADESTFVLAVPDAAAARHPAASMLRRLSALPSDVRDVALEATVVDGRLEVQLTVQKQVPLVGYVILAWALFSVSSQGAALQTLVGVSPLLKMVWRYFGSSCLCGILSTLNFLDMGRLPTMAARVVVRDMLVCVVSYVVFAATFIWALDHTSVGHAYIFSNSHSILLVVGKFFVGQPVATMEAVGAMLGIVGGVVTSTDHGSAAAAGSRGTNAPEPTVQGDVVAFLGAVGGVAYLMYAKHLRETMGVWLFCFCLFTGTWITLVPLLSVLDVDYDLSTDAQRGFFGWTNHLGIELVLVVVVSACGSMGFVSSLKYFPPLVVSVTMLLEPVVATAICIALGMATTPGVLTFVGGLAVIIGTLLVILGSSSSTETINVTQAMIPGHAQEGMVDHATRRPSSGGGTALKGYGSCS
ncbi:Aste57867_5081 [Aphanomyces stellatus]|uniref:Aste57867_5081 protein n=1 Tax=Aphanomyces stellatus TaxID=120398 RepID=A0A485KH85_9STRA|nr:hypothetical protein As57867_005068 [Aphanomyces stellatus]VFT82162.1 Aste57867_5081 [Aphanomyces stellatus]